MDQRGLTLVPAAAAITGHPPVVPDPEDRLLLRRADLWAQRLVDGYYTNFAAELNAVVEQITLGAVDAADVPARFLALVHVLVDRAARAEILSRK